MQYPKNQLWHYAATSVDYTFDFSAPIVCRFPCGTIKSRGVVVDPVFLPLFFNQVSIR